VAFVSIPEQQAVKSNHCSKNTNYDHIVILYNKDGFCLKKLLIRDEGVGTEVSLSGFFKEF
jgi:hypothetical protein